MADRLGIPEVYTDHRELCSRDDLDGVTIASPNYLHAEQSIAAFASGKNVFCEKPLALTVKEAREMLAAAEKSRMVHQVAFTYRYLDGVRELKRRVQAGDVGEPYFIRLSHSEWRDIDTGRKSFWRGKQRYAGGGVSFDVGSHLFDLVHFILGPIDAATGFLQSIPRRHVDSETSEAVDVETDDLASAWFRLKSGIQGQWFASRVAPSHMGKAYVEVIGREGALQASLSRGAVDVLRLSRPSRPEWVECELPRGAGVTDEIPHCLTAMMQSFVESCLRGQIDEEVDATFKDGLVVQQGLAAVTESNQRSDWIRLDSAT